MLSALLHLSRIVTLLCGICAKLNAQDYEIRLVRTVKVGHQYSMVANCTAEKHITVTAGGQTSPQGDEEIIVHLSAKAEVLAVTASGLEAKSRFTITKLTRTSGPQTDEQLSVGTVVIAERNGTQTDFKVSNAPVEPDVARLLGSLISLESDEGANDDTIFGTKARKKAGDSWPIDPTSASARLAKSEIKVNPANITGTTTLVEVGERSLKLASAIAATGFDLSLPFSPAMKVTNSALNARLTGIFPIDLAKRVLYSAVNVDSKVEFAGKIGAKEVKIVATLKHAKDVTFTEL